jgi:hypothetical protein
MAETRKASRRLHPPAAARIESERSELEKIVTHLLNKIPFNRETIKIYENDVVGVCLQFVNASD